MAQGHPGRAGLLAWRYYINLLQNIFNRIQRDLRAGFVLIAARTAHADAADMFTARGDDRQSTGEDRGSGCEFESLDL